jgi:hypothetical protein
MDEKKQSERRGLPTSPSVTFLDALHVIPRCAVPNPKRLTHLMNREPLYKEFSRTRACTLAGIGAREIRLPWALARAMPALTRALMSARSNGAREAITVKIIAPWGVVVAMFS